MVQRKHRERQSRREQERPTPVERWRRVLLRRHRKHEPGGDDRDQSNRNIDPKHPAPPQSPDQQASRDRTGADPDRLGGGIEPKRAPAPALVRRLDDKRHAVGANHRSAHALQEPKPGKGEEIRGEAAKSAGGGEQDEANDVKQLPAKDPAKLTEDRHERRDTQEISERHPAYALQRGVEDTPQSRQCELDNARVDLAHETGNAARADHQPWIGGQAGEKGDGRRLGAMADKVTQAKSRRGNQIFGAHPTPLPSPIGSGHMDRRPRQKSSA